MFAVRWLMLIPALVSPAVASAQEDPAAGQYVSRQEYEKLLREMEVLKAQMKALAAPGAPAVTPVAPAVTTEAPKAPSAPLKPAPAQPTIAETETGDREDEAREAQRQLDTFLRRQKLLFQAGEVEIDFGAAYAKESFGGVGTRFANASVTARYGVADDIEFDLTVPLRYVEQFDRFGVVANSINPGGDRRPSSVGLGDIDWAVRYAALREEGLLPDVVVALNAKSTTGDEDRELGTGHWNVGTTVTLVKTIDPVVFFGSLGYAATLEDDGVNPGDEIPYSAGLGFSLNDRVSFTTTLIGLAVRRRSGPDPEEDSSSGSADINLLQFATTVQLMPGLFIEPFAAFGLTEESPDFIVGISVPYQIPGRFPLPFVSEWLTGK